MKNQIDLSINLAMKLQGLILYFESFISLTLCHRNFLDEERAKGHGLRIYSQFVSCRDVLGNKRSTAILQQQIFVREVFEQK